MFGIGMPELIIIFLVALIIVGPKKLPDLAKTLAKGLGEFRKAADEVKTQVTETEAYQEFQGIKDNFGETMDSVNPKKMMDDAVKDLADDEKPSEAIEAQVVEADDGAALAGESEQGGDLPVDAQYREVHPEEPEEGTGEAQAAEHETEAPAEEVQTDAAVESETSADDEKDPIIEAEAETPAEETPAKSDEGQAPAEDREAPRKDA